MHGEAVLLQKQRRGKAEARIDAKAANGGCMLSILARWLLTSTAMAPVALTYGWVAFQAGDQGLGALLWGLCAVLVGGCLWLLQSARKHLERMRFTAQSVETADSEYLAFFLLYALPLFTAKINELTWQIWVPILAIFAIVTAKSYGYHFNPLLGMMGWHFYKITSSFGVTYVLITKKTLRSVDEEMQVGQLTEYILIDLGNNK